MTTQPMTHELCERIRVEHTEIDDLVRTLYRVLAERHEPVSRVAHLLESLLERIAAHFMDEESSGLFEDLRRLRPQNSELIQTLEKEHLQMVRDLQQLCLLVPEGEWSPERWTRLEDGFRELGMQMCRHEARENDMLQEAYEEDLGDQD